MCLCATERKSYVICKKAATDESEKKNSKMNEIEMN